MAIVLRERDRDELLDKLESASTAGVGAPTLAETAIVLASRLGDEAPVDLARFVERAGLVVIAFGQLHWWTAAEAWLRFGKGRHPAALNFGDCLAYATAQVAAEPLLCKGDDFSKTDLALA
ncbi:MAG: type II toxin-antitoxin system VapC family toxin [Gaiellaceae bacterium]